MKKVLIIAPRHYVDDLSDYYVRPDILIKYLDEEKAEKSDLSKLTPRLLKKYDGFIGLADWSSLYAAYLNRECGTPHPSPAVVARLQDKLLSRRMQAKYFRRKRVRSFKDSDPTLLHARYPLFIKPRRASMSYLAFVVNSHLDVTGIASVENKNDLRKKNARWLKLYEHIGLGEEIKDGIDGFVVESLLGHGSQLTLDGYVLNGKVSFLGFTKSVFLPNHISFKRFDYPYRLPKKLTRRIEKHARKFVERSKFNNSLFNIEYKYNIASSSFELIEINTRPSSQFMYSIYCVAGVHPLDIAIDIVLGLPIKSEFKKTPHAMSSICVFRRPQDARLVRTPDEKQLTWFRSEYPFGRVNLFARPGERLSDHPNDSHSYRYAEMIVLHTDQLPVQDFESHLKSKFDESIDFERV